MIWSVLTKGKVVQGHGHGCPRLTEALSPTEDLLEHKLLLGVCVHQ